MTATKQRTSFIQQPMSPRVACRACHAVFEDLNGHKICDVCLVDRVNGAGELELDDPDDVINRAVRITCRVCGIGAIVPLDWPALLCEPCLTNLDATRERVQAWLSAALVALDANQAHWEATRAASPAQARWETVQAALIGVAEKRVSQAAFDATWAKRKQEGGALSQLLMAYESYARESDRLGAELRRLALAQTEINQAWLATSDI